MAGLSQPRAPHVSQWHTKFRAPDDHHHMGARPAWLTQLLRVMDAPVATPLHTSVCMVYPDLYGPQLPRRARPPITAVLWPLFTRLLASAVRVAL